MTIVIDTNIIANHLLIWDDQFYAIFEQNEWISPSFLKSEFCQVLWKQREEFSLHQLILCWNSGINLIDHFYTEPFYIESALEMAIKNNHAYYDCAFFALATLTNSPIMTADKKMKVLAKKLNIQII
ncbi:MAG: type II toxin-antitoxin system VapC family toxin [Saprospiraceae bacterium]|nr:type II toxin-antitoxin system VapC family toxin [Saprospiraceae bacterium]